jgi:glutathione S-transferase
VSADYELFWVSGSPYVSRVQLALEYNGMPYTSRRMDSAQVAERSLAFLQLNPRGKVPVLKTDNGTL